MGVNSAPETARWEFQDNLAATRGKGPGILLAWSEGFAYWFSLTAQDVEGVAALAIPEAGDLFIDTGTFRGPDRVDLAFNDGLPSLGEDSTLSVARALMAFRLDPGINMSDTQIINALRAVGADQLSDAVIALMVSANAAKFDDSQPVDAARVALSNDFACVLTGQAVAPKFTAPPSGTHLISGPPALTYSWEPNGAGSFYQLDQFTVQFWSENWDTLLFESPQDTATSFTPDPPQLDQIFNALAASGGQPNAINVVVKGRNTDAPATGPYKSCAITQPVDLDPVVTATPLDPAHPLVPYIYLLDGLVPLAATQFTLVARQLQPHTQYDFVLTDPATGVPDTQLANPPPMSDANGQITLTLTLPPVPAHDSWTLRGTPPAGPAVETKLKTGWSAGYWRYWDGSTPRGTYKWGGSGLKPGPRPSFSWNGVVVAQSIPGMINGYYYGEYPEPSPSWPGYPSFTVGIDGVTLGGSASATFGPAPYDTSPLRFSGWAVGG